MAEGNVDIKKNDPIAIGWLPGKVIPMGGQDGSHVDVRMLDPEGNNLSWNEVKKYIQKKTSWADVNSSNFDAYLRSFSEKWNGTLAFGGSESERQAALENMWYSSWSEFNGDYDKWLQSKVQEQPDPWFITALEYVRDNPLFDYTDSEWVEYDGLLWKQWLVDAKAISQIEHNLMIWEQWDKWLFGTTLLRLRKIPEMWNFIESLRTIRNSKVIDIVKSGKVKLYPMSDADIWLLAGSVWLQVNSFAEPTKAKSTMEALNSLLDAYSLGDQTGWGQWDQTGWDTKVTVDQFQYTPSFKK